MNRCSGARLLYVGGGHDKLQVDWDKYTLSISISLDMGRLYGID
jgi:hypothetical protein